MEIAHQTCLKIVNHQGPYNDLYLALLCGVKITDPQLKSIFSYTGLYHLLIVSGAHVQMLGNILTRLKLPYGVQFFLLFIYTSCCQFQAPCFRAWLQHGITHLNKTKQLNYCFPFIVFISLFITTAIFPKNLTTVSIPLSGVAALALSQPSKNNLLQHGLLYLIMLPLVSMFANVHPISLFLNILATYTWGLFIFPTTFFAGIFPELRVVTDPIWQFVESFLNWVFINLPVYYFKTTYSVTFAWGYLLVVTLYFYKKSIRQRIID